MEPFWLQYTHPKCRGCCCTLWKGWNALVFCSASEQGSATTPRAQHLYCSTCNVLRGKGNLISETEPFIHARKAIKTCEYQLHGEGRYSQIGAPAGAGAWCVPESSSPLRVCTQGCPALQQQDRLGFVAFVPHSALKQ